MLHYTQLHYWGCLLPGGIFAILGLFCVFRLIDTFRQRSRRDIIAGAVLNMGLMLIAFAYLRAAYLPFNPKHPLAGLLMPTGLIGKAIMYSGLACCLCGVLLTPLRSVEKDAKKQLPNNKNLKIQKEIWPPPPDK
jgi:hypothetical protein